MARSWCVFLFSNEENTSEITLRNDFAEKRVLVLFAIVTNLLTKLSKDAEMKEERECSR